MNAHEKNVSGGLTCEFLAMWSWIGNWCLLSEAELVSGLQFWKAKTAVTALFF